MTRALAGIVLAVPFSVAFVVDARAQQSTTQGWVVGMDVGGTAVSLKDEPSDRAGLVGARVGYGVNRVLTLYLGVYEADIDVSGFEAFDTATFGHLDLGMGLHLADRRRAWVPYGDLALTVWPVSDVLESAERTTTDFSSIPTLSLGGGLAIYLSEAWALDVNFKRGIGVFRDVEPGNLSAGGRERHVHTFLRDPCRIGSVHRGCLVVAVASPRLERRMAGRDA